MPPRGSVQFLLHFFRSRHRLRWTMGAVGGVALAAALLLTGGPIPTPDRLAQALRERAWDRALAGLPEQAAWPWMDARAGTRAKVTRLGLSASLVDESLSGDPGAAAGNAVSKVTIGDRIVLTTASGASRVYRVTSSKVVDPHLSESSSTSLGGDAALVTCQQADLATSLHLILEATTVESPAPKPKPEQKL